MRFLIKPVLVQKLNLGKVGQRNLRFTDIPVGVIGTRLLKCSRRKAVSMVFVAEITPPEISPESSVCLDIDPAHQLVIGQASVLSRHLIVGGEPYNRMMVLVLVHRLQSDFLFLEVDRLVMERVRIKFQIGRSQGKLTRLENDPILDEARVYLKTQKRPKKC